MELSLFIVLSLLIFLVAILYSSVGHGGASGYLAVLSFFSFAPAVMSSTALLLNILVAGVGTVAFYRAGYFSKKLAWPLIVLSIPAAFLGGLLPVTEKVYFILLTFILLVASYRMASFQNSKEQDEPLKPLSIPTALPIGGGIGLLSGIVGVGGGIFLSPIMILKKWATAKQTAALSAIFIVVNSFAGLAGRFVRGNLEFGAPLFLVFIAFVGGLIGSHMGANKFSGLTLRRLLALVLLIAAVKLVLKVISS